MSSDKPAETLEGDLLVSAEQGVRVEEVDGRKIARFSVAASMQGHTFAVELSPSGDNTPLTGPFRIEYVLGSEFIIHDSELPSFRLEDGFSHITISPEFKRLSVTLTYFDDKDPAVTKSANLSLAGADGVLQRLVVDTDEKDLSRAIRHTGQIVADLLDALSFTKRVPITVRHIEIHGCDQKQQRRYVTLPYGRREMRPEDLGQAAAFPHRLRAPLRLFREGLSSNKPHYRLLCLYRIREALKPVQHQNNADILATGGTPNRPIRLLPDNPLTRTYFPGLIGKKIGAFLDHVRSAYRLPVAHGSVDEYFKLVLDPADVRIDHRVDFTNAALIPVLAELLQDEIDLMARHGLVGQQPGMVTRDPPAA